MGNASTKRLDCKICYFTIFKKIQIIFFKIESIMVKFGLLVLLSLIKLLLDFYTISERLFQNIHCTTKANVMTLLLSYLIDQVL